MTTSSRWSSSAIPLSVKPTSCSVMSTSNTKSHTSRPLESILKSKPSTSITSRSRCKSGTLPDSKGSRPSPKLIIKELLVLHLCTRLLTEKHSRTLKTGSRKLVSHSLKAFVKSSSVTSVTAATKIDKLLLRRDKNWHKNTA
jgi:hypothetical protein